MRTIKTLLPLFLIVLFAFSANAQEINASIKDAKTKEPIPYVTVLAGKKKGVITNEEGRFSLSIEKAKETDSLYISCVGYESFSKLITEFKDSIVFLHPKTIELNEIIVSNKNYTAKEIIDFVKDSLDKNYNKDLSKKKLFFRESYHQNLDKTNYTFMKSTIDELNKPFLDSILRSVPKRDDFYNEMLCELYGNYEQGKQKIDIIKACNLYDESTSLDLDKLEERFNDIIKKNVKPNSYFKIKSGIFGTKVDADEMGLVEAEKDSAALKKELEERKKREASRKSHFATRKKSELMSQLKNLIFMEDTPLNVIEKSGRYRFTLQEYTYLGDEPVYVLDFEPKRGADYRGRMYVNMDDFAIIRIDYDNVKPLRSIKLLGISFKEHIAQGKMIFSKGENDKYNLRFYEKIEGTQAGIRRPLKIIEKNKIVKGKNRQNELYVKIDMGVTSVNKYEIVVFDAEPLTSGQYSSFTEKSNVTVKKLKKYDPEFWKGYNIIEPNQAIRDFTATEE